MEQNNKKNIISELIKWIGVSILLITSIIGNYLYRNEYNFAIKSIIFTIIMIVNIGIISSTKIGRSIINLGYESFAELNKIIWPTFWDGLNTTCIVITVTILMSLILWGLDTIAVHVISFGLRL